MSILRGQFAVLLVVSVPVELGATGVEQALAAVAERLDLVVVVRPVRPSIDPAEEPPAGTDADGTVYAFSVHGADRPGIVHRAAEALGSAGGNIVDLSTRLVGSIEAPVYVLTLTVAFGSGGGVEAAVGRACEAVEAFGVQCRAHRVEIDVL